MKLKSSPTSQPLEFELTQTAETDGEYVIKSGLIFRAGLYKDKDNFKMTPDELKAAADDFKPVELDYEHKAGFLDGKFGTLEAVKTSNDGSILFGAAKIPKWLNNLVGNDPIRVSCTWNRENKKLTKLALTGNPRVSDAAIFAAFTKDKIENGQADNTEVIKDILTYFAESKSNQTYEGRSSMQTIHDCAARSGAICKKMTKSEEEKEHSMYAVPQDGTNNAKAEFISKDESKAMQKIHDAAITGGAECYFLNDSKPYYFSDHSEEKEDDYMTLKERFLKFFDQIDSDEAEKETVVENSTAEDPEVTALKAKLAEAEAKLSANETEKVLSEADKQKKELEAKLAEAEAKVTAQEAAKFTNELLEAGKILPAEVDSITAIFSQLAGDDKASQTQINFSEGKQLNRVDAFKELLSARPSNKLTEEKLSSTVVLSNDEGKTVDYSVLLADAEKRVSDYLKVQRNKKNQ